MQNYIRCIAKSRSGRLIRFCLHVPTPPVNLILLEKNYHFGKYFLPMLPFTFLLCALHLVNVKFFCVIWWWTLDLCLAGGGSLLDLSLFNISHGSKCMPSDVQWPWSHGRGGSSVYSMSTCRGWHGSPPESQRTFWLFSGRKRYYRPNVWILITKWTQAASAYPAIVTVPVL